VLTHLIIFIASFILAVNSLYAGSLPTEKRQAIDEILDLNHTDKLVGLMTSSLTQQILSSISQRNNKPIRPEFASLVTKEVNTVMYEEFIIKNKLNEIFYSLYDEYFTTQQLKEFVAFQKSATGERFKKYMPDVTERSMAMAKEQALDIPAKVQSRLMAIFDKVEQNMTPKPIDN
jgi:hypothetical protein